MISFSSRHSQLLPICPHASCLLASAALLPSVCFVPSVFIAESNVPYWVLLCYRGSLLVVSLSNTGSQTPHCPLQPQPYPCLTHGSCFSSLHAESHSQPYGTAVSRSCLRQPSPFDEGLAEMQGNAGSPRAWPYTSCLTLQFHTTCRVLKSCSAISSLPILQPISSEFSSGGQGLLEVLGRLGLTVCLRQMKRISF